METYVASPGRTRVLVSAGHLYGLDILEGPERHFREDGGVPVRTGTCFRGENLTVMVRGCCALNGGSQSPGSAANVRARE